MKDLGHKTNMQGWVVLIPQHFQKYSQQKKKKMNNASVSIHLKMYNKHSSSDFSLIY